MSFTVFSYNTYSTNQTSDIINCSGSLGIKFVVTTGELNGAAMLFHVWPCDSSGNLSTPIIGQRNIYPDTLTTVIDLQQGITAEVSEPSENYYVVTIDSPLPPFIKVLIGREDFVDQTYGIEAVLF